MATLTLHPFILAGILAAITYGILSLIIKFRNSPKLQMVAPVAAVPVTAFAASNAIPRMHPALPPGAELEIEGIEDDTILELVEDDGSILLKEAEAVTDEITRVIAGVASNPPNPTEVFTKLRALLSQYSIFQDTEFYDAINRFVEVAVQRDLGLQFSYGQLTEMWS